MKKFINVPTAYTRGGGSIPIVAAFDEILAITSCTNGLRFNIAKTSMHQTNISI